MGKTVIFGFAIALGLAATIWIADKRFDRWVERTIEQLLEQGIPAQRTIGQGDPAGLPEPIQQWLHASGVVDRPVPTTVRLRQEGEIRLGPDQPWMRSRADQYYTLDPVASLWRVAAAVAPGIFIRGVDSFDDGRGGMQMMPLALF